MKIIGTLRELDETRGAVRVEEVYDTDIDDLWDACTTRERLARWVAEVTGDLHLGGEFKASFSSGWEGQGRVERCEPPRRLVVSTWEAERQAENTLEVTLTPDGDRTILVIEETGMPIGEVTAYGAGWQIHMEDLAAHLSGSERCDMKTRWLELSPAYSQLAVDAPTE